MKYEIERIEVQNAKKRKSLIRLKSKAARGMLSQDDLVALNGNEKNLKEAEKKKAQLVKRLEK